MADGAAPRSWWPTPTSGVRGPRPGGRGRRPRGVRLDRRADVADAVAAQRCRRVVLDLGAANLGGARPACRRTEPSAPSAGRRRRAPARPAAAWPGRPAPTPSWSGRSTPRELRPPSPTPWPAPSAERAAGAAAAALADALRLDARRTALGDGCITAANGTLMPPRRRPFGLDRSTTERKVRARRRVRSDRQHRRTVASRDDRPCPSATAHRRRPSAPSAARPCSKA